MSQLIRAESPVVTNDLAQLRLDLDEYGYCLVRELLDAHALTRIRDCLAVSAERQRQEPSSGPGAEPDWEPRDGDQWIPLMVGEDELDDLLGHEFALSLAKHLLGERFHLSEFSTHIIHSGNQTMELHTDQWWMPRPEMPNAPKTKPGDVSRAIQPYGQPLRATHPICPAVVLSFMWAITDFTKANGCTRLVPCSHHSGLHPDPAVEYDIAYAEVPAGGAVVWDARTWHASGENKTGTPRVGIQTSYCAPQFRQLRNFTVALRPEVQARLSDELRSLLGFKLWSSYGSTDDYEAVFARPGYERFGKD